MHFIFVTYQKKKKKDTFFTNIDVLFNINNHGKLE